MWKANREEEILKFRCIGDSNFVVECGVWVIKVTVLLWFGDTNYTPSVALFADIFKVVQLFIWQSFVYTPN